MLSPGPEVQLHSLEVGTLDSRQTKTSSAFSALPLHRRFRLWLPVLAAAPALLFLTAVPFNSLDGESLLGSTMYSNFLLHGLARLAFRWHDWSTLLQAEICLMLGFWYLVGYILDRLRSRESAMAGPLAVWGGLLACLAAIELVRLAVNGRGITQWFYIGLSAVSAFWQHSGGAEIPVSSLARFNINLISYGAPVGAAVVWMLVLWHTGRATVARVTGKDRKTRSQSQFSLAHWRGYPRSSLKSPATFIARLRGRSLFVYVAALAAGWLLLSIAVQNSAVFWKLIRVFSLALVLWFFVPRSSPYRWILYGSLPTLGLLLLAGSYNPERDLLLFGLGAALVYGLWLTQVGLRARPFVSAVILFLVTWGLCSAGDLLPADLGYRVMARDWIGTPDRFAELYKKYPDKHVGVALSGGGFRAALMHGGALYSLEGLQIPVTNVSAVSGGSITAAHWALGAYPQELLYDVIFRQFNTARDVVDLQNASRLLLSAYIPGTGAHLLPGFDFTRTDVQAHAWDRALLHGKRFADLPPTAPRLMICTTDLNTGNAVGLTADWRITRFLLQPPGEELFGNVRELRSASRASAQDSSFALLDSRQTPLSKAVAASSAFPLAFDPVHLSAGSQAFLLADGGVTDNTGMTLLLEADRRAKLPADANGNPQGDKDWALDEAISLDAGAMYQRSAAAPRLTSLEAFARAVDIIYARIGPEITYSDGAPAHAPATVLLSPYLYMDNSRNYDFSKIAKTFDGLADDPQKKLARDYPEPDPVEPRPINPGLFSSEQQQLFSLVAHQVARMDKHTLYVLLYQLWERPAADAEPKWIRGFLEGVNPGYYGPLGRGLDIGWLTDDDLRVLRDSADGRRVQPERLARINEDRAFRVEQVRQIALRVAEDLSVCLATFVRTPTLQDKISPEDAARIFRLGQYLVLLNSPDIIKPIVGNSPSFNAPNSQLLTPGEQAAIECSVDALTRQTGPVRSISLSPEFASCMAARVSKDPALGTNLQGLRFSF